MQATAIETFKVRQTNPNRDNPEFIRKYDRHLKSLGYGTFKKSEKGEPIRDLDGTYTIKLLPEARQFADYFIKCLQIKSFLVKGVETTN